MKISSNFDSGNIEVVRLESATDIQLNIKKDNNSDFYQWFHFKLETSAGEEHTIKILNAQQSAYPEGWKDYNVMASYDRNTWFRVDTDYDDGPLVINHIPEFDHVFYAYFVPYSYERHLDLIHSAQLNPNTQLTTLGQTIDGRDISVIQVGEPAEHKKSIWITARQHPGESMAEWYVEGLLERLFDLDDATSRLLQQKAVFYIVPNMNPDGSVRGHLRTNANGVNLNREWLTPSKENSPEVYYVREHMLSTGVDMFLDIHGDEAIPYNFVAGCEGIESYDQKHSDLETLFKQSYAAVTPEFQDEFGYPKDEPGQALKTVGSAWVGEQFKCLAYTVEMPFKDHNNAPDVDYGWNDVRSAKFGADVLTAILAVVDTLR
ncbi:M14-type cytosolic carboxypeptidase [Psychrosphaera sp. 1_MG-2023]|uniref:M14 family metallopeptidase n=1 Tax=Psychrosphaera sp. 1_MG-2023 TaxID=3062643 RepID=UPI0026E489DB|nr:M14-type cytosolic carboxypeptidase [Psychrosphaera sp. 1_MG-2023]MDO6717893.1 M14-type cytosolic carboxypeptidase [Psychrosphaera sp. 1_MG-2023]